MRVKYLTQSIVIAGAKANEAMEEIVNITLPSEYNQVTGIAFFEAANANDNDYELRISDNSEVYQDYTTKYDYLSIIKGTSIKNVPFEGYYKPYTMPCSGNNTKVAIKYKNAIPAGQSISLRIVIRVEK